MKVNSTQQNAFWETDIRTVIRGILRVVWETKFHYRVVTMLPMAPDLSKTNPPIYSWKICFNIIPNVWLSTSHSLPTFTNCNFLSFAQTSQCVLYRQPTRCNNNGLLIIPISSTCFGRWFRQSSGAPDCLYSLWYNAPTKLPAGSLDAEFLRIQTTGRQHRGCLIPQAVNTV